MALASLGAGIEIFSSLNVAYIKMILGGGTPLVPDKLY